jgi:hypothetical protein
MKHFVLSLAVALVSLQSISGALARESVLPVRDLEGWQCMSPKGIYEPDGINYTGAPVYSGPDAGAAQVGLGNGVIIVPNPLKPENGRTVMIWPNGKKVWIAVNELTNWHAVSDPSAQCVPALLSNGRYGTRTIHQ